MNLIKLPIARYRLQFKVTEPIHLPDYAGSTLRGVFGRALRKISCMTKQKECKTCPLYRSCPYTAIFETPAPENHQVQKFSQVPNGYIIEPPKWGSREYNEGEILALDLVLFGKLIQQLPLIAFAFQRAFSYSVAHGKGELADILHQQQNGEFISIYENEQLQDHLTEIAIPESVSDSITLNIETPLRLQANGKPLNEKAISAQRLLMGLAKRISLLSEFHSTPIELDFAKLKRYRYHG